MIAQRERGGGGGYGVQENIVLSSLDTLHFCDIKGLAGNFMDIFVGCLPLFCRLWK